MTAAGADSITALDLFGLGGELLTDDDLRQLFELVPNLRFLALGGELGQVSDAALGHLGARMLQEAHAPPHLCVHVSVAVGTWADHLCSSVSVVKRMEENTTKVVSWSGCVSKTCCIIIQSVPSLTHAPAGVHICFFNRYLVLLIHAAGSSLPGGGIQHDTFLVLQRCDRNTQATPARPPCHRSFSDAGITAMVGAARPGKLPIRSFVGANRISREVLASLLPGLVVIKSVTDAVTEAKKEVVLRFVIGNEPDLDLRAKMLEELLKKNPQV